LSKSGLRGSSSEGLFHSARGIQVVAWSLLLSSGKLCLILLLLLNSHHLHLHLHLLHLQLHLGLSLEIH
jgi:hypothetical protein